MKATIKYECRFTPEELAELEQAIKLAHEALIAAERAAERAEQRANYRARVRTLRMAWREVQDALDPAI